MKYIPEGGGAYSAEVIRVCPEGITLKHQHVEDPTRSFNNWFSVEDLDQFILTLNEARDEVKRLSELVDPRLYRAEEGVYVEEHRNSSVLVNIQDFTETKLSRLTNPVEVFLT